MTGTLWQDAREACAGPSPWAGGRAPDVVPIGAARDACGERWREGHRQDTDRPGTG
ncbi:hypothetical protein ACFWVC_22520 [Streptomyces sp. NPDC058691]|uniref:hypothetical protein n=1 Tax=Streptomyces sp. NPDC058691 TaxID=3346601 RepID=UPI003662587E